MIYTENMLSLFPNRFRIYHSGMWIKRESGVNPGQSRCCEAPKNILKQHYRHWFWRPGRLQDGSQSEDLPFIKGCFCSRD